MKDKRKIEECVIVSVVKVKCKRDAEVEGEALHSYKRMWSEGMQEMH